MEVQEETVKIQFYLLIFFTKILRELGPRMKLAMIRIRKRQILPTPGFFQHAPNTFINF